MIHNTGKIQTPQPETALAVSFYEKKHCSKGFVVCDWNAFRRHFLLEHRETCGGNWLGWLSGHRNKVNA